MLKAFITDTCIEQQEEFSLNFANSALIQSLIFSVYANVLRGKKTDVKHISLENGDAGVYNTDK